MRKTAIVACVPLLAGALGAQTATKARLPGEGGQGVTVLLLPPSPQTHEPLRYVLNEPAYVAAFIVYPGAGVRLLYPTVDIPERLHRDGYNTEQLIGASFDNDIYHAVLGPRLAGPAYLYVIASQHPLDVARYVHKPMTLASAIGERDSRSFYTDVQFDALLNNAILLGDDTSWDSDMYMLWPNSKTTTAYASGMTPNAMQYRTLLCSDGNTRVLPTNYPFIGCPGQARVRPSDQAPRQVQQSASAAEAVSAPLHSGRPAGGVAIAAATVLPTIVGVRMTDAQRRADIQEHAASQRLTYTAANGDPQVAAPVAEATSQPQLQVIDVYRDRSAEHERRDRGAIHGQYSAERREQFAHQARQPEQDGRSAGSPQLAPNPRLSPNPTLAPSPGLAPSRMRSEAPRVEQAQRELRNEQRSAPSPTARFEQPRLTQPAAASSTPGAATDNPTRERPARIQQ